MQLSLIDAKSKIFYSTTTQSFGNHIERSRAMLLRLVQLDQSLAYIHKAHYWLVHVQGVQLFG